MFHFGAGEIWEMDLDEIEFWHAQAVRLHE